MLGITLPAHTAELGNPNGRLSLFGVAADRRNQFAGALRAFSVSQVGAGNMFADVRLYDLVNQSIHCAARLNLP